MQVDQTFRGFDRIEFKDFYDTECSLQKSSLATEDAIWLGVNDAKPKVLIPGKGWIDMSVPDDAFTSTRMHLTREQVRELLPHLINFVETGAIK